MTHKRRRGSEDKTNMKSALMLKGILGAAAVFSAVSVVSAAVVPKVPSVMAASMISEGNRYLDELEYTQAVAQYEMALEIEPKNVEAIRGIVEAAYQAGDLDKAEEYIQYYWETASGDEDFYQENRGELMNMTRGAGQLFGEPGNYADFLLEMQESMEEEDFHRIASEAISALTARGDYDKAMELAQILYDSTGSKENRDILVKLYELSAEQAWREHDYDRALALLEKAMEYDGESDRLKDELQKVAEDCIFLCINSQQYDKAEELIGRVQTLKGDDSLSGYMEDIARMRETDDTLQGLIEKLNAAFVADDITEIETLMNSKEFEDSAGEIRSVLYCSALRQGEKPQGLGTAIYIIGGKPYVYYGDYRDGKRQGSGRWYYSSGEGYLTKYTLNWENDLPNGPGRLDNYGTLSHHNEYGEVTGESRTKDDIALTCVNGVLEGDYIEHSDVLDDDGYSYDLTIKLVNGYRTPLRKGEYPSEIDMYNGGREICAYTIVQQYDPYWEVYYESYVWKSYSTSQWTVSGFESCIPKVSSGTETLVLQAD